MEVSAAAVKKRTASMKLDELRGAFCGPGLGSRGDGNTFVDDADFLVVGAAARCAPPAVAGACIEKRGLLPLAPVALAPVALHATVACRCHLFERWRRRRWLRGNPGQRRCGVGR